MDLSPQTKLDFWKSKEKNFFEGIHWKSFFLVLNHKSSISNLNIFLKLFKFWFVCMLVAFARFRKYWHIKGCNVNESHETMNLNNSSRLTHYPNPPVWSKKKKIKSARKSGMIFLSSQLTNSCKLHIVIATLVQKLQNLIIKYTFCVQTALEITFLYSDMFPSYQIKYWNF